MAHPLTRKGLWIEERMLGSGGFGAVHLWRNEVRSSGSASGENLSMGFPTKPDTNRAVQPQKIARGLNFQF